MVASGKLMYVRLRIEYYGREEDHNAEGSDRTQEYKIIT